jgi:RNA recognition motif-containing protein
LFFFLKYGILHPGSYASEPGGSYQLTVSREVSHMNIYVGNLSFEAGEADVRQMFEAHGQVASVSIIEDKFTGRPRGFAFVEMPTDAEAQAAIAALNAKDYKGRPLTVNEARPRTEHRGGSGGGGGGGGFRGNKGGGRREW